MREKSSADGPDRAVISFKSAPTEKNFEFPAMMSGTGWLRSSATAAVSERTHDRVKRFVPSGEIKRRCCAPAMRSISKKDWAIGARVMPNDLPKSAQGRCGRVSTER